MGMMGGSIWCVSEENKGSAFYFALPFHRCTETLVPLQFQQSQPQLRQVKQYRLTYQLEEQQQQQEREEEVREGRREKRATKYVVLIDQSDTACKIAQKKILYWWGENSNNNNSNKTDSTNEVVDVLTFSNTTAFFSYLNRSDNKGKSSNIAVVVIDNRQPEQDIEKISSQFPVVISGYLLLLPSPTTDSSPVPSPSSTTQEPTAPHKHPFLKKPIRDEYVIFCVFPQFCNLPFPVSLLSPLFPLSSLPHFLLLSVAFLSPLSQLSPH